MFGNALTLIYGVLLLAFGFVLTAAFANIRFTGENVLLFLCLYIISGGLQLITMFIASEEVVWKVYPLITHLPLILFLHLTYHKSVATSVTATFTAYLFCIPPKWFGILIGEITGSAEAELIARILFMIPIAYIALAQMSSYFAEIFSKDARSVCIFGFVPIVYYFFDYITSVYTDLWLSNHRLVAESIPFLLVVTYMVFCAIYYKEYERKVDAQLKEQIVKIAVEQQAKEIMAIKQTAHEIHLIRHDMRMFLSSLAVSIENGEMENVRIMLTSQLAHIDGTKLVRYCNNNIVNCVISDYVARCAEKSVNFSYNIKLEELSVDEIMFSAILSNALDNALNAQKHLVPERRSIKLMIKISGGNILLSVKNAVGQKVLFSDGLPVSVLGSHGHGTQSIRYLTERLGGNCQFSVQDDTFILRVVL